MKIRTQLLTTFMFIFPLVLIAPCTYALETARVSVSTGHIQANNDSFLPDLNENGRLVVYHSNATNLVPGDTNGVRDVFVYDRQTGVTTRVSVATGGGQGNGESFDAALSADGRYVAFRSDATNLIPGDANGTVDDVFVHDRQTGTTSRVSVATGGGKSNNNSFRPALSADGRFVVFHSFGTNLVPNDTNNVLDVFVHDRQTVTTTRVSVVTGGIQANNTSRAGFLSADGRFVSFESDATNLVAGENNGVRDVFIHDRQTVTTTRVSVATGGGQVNGASVDAELSADGRYVTFQSDATNLVPGDTNGVGDVFVHDRQTGFTTRVSIPSSGSLQANEESLEATISGDGRFVAFLSFATNLVPADTNGDGDVFVHDRQTNTTTMMSVSTGGVKGNDFSCNPAISQDGRIVGFFSDSTNLVPGDTNGIRDIFIHDRTVDFDVDGNGTADLVWRNTMNGATMVWQMTAAALRGPITFAGGMPGHWVIRDVADVNGDGRADLVWRNTTNGATMVWQMTAAGLRGPITFAGGMPLHWEIQAVADVNGDGRADLVWRNTSNGATMVWQMRADGRRGPITFAGGMPLHWEIQAVADVNGDGRADLVWRNTSNGATMVWQMTAAGGRGPITFAGGMPLNWAIQGVADVNGDGRADLVWRNTSNGATMVWQMTAAGLRGPITFAGGMPLHWEIQNVVDVNGDSRADLVWRNTTNGATMVWQMTAAGLRGPITFPGGMPLVWVLQP